ncbi:1,2-dihydroxy-3-keto-5-methylthiopentene dioxygenase [Bacterioplanoides pacificum]|uniref:Acireductone dioxygenase n=1 Tax=Bacterioplanoides pacificum TaxID=1171596 RepID=A0ABV7VPS6_9GAMM
MSEIRIYTETDMTNLLFTSDNKKRIAERLQPLGIRYEQWQTADALSAGADSEQVMAAYQPDIDRLKAEGGYQTVDVISLTADHPQKDELRQKFLSEHTHSEDEVRFFVAGQGLFTLHLEGKVVEILCTAGDLISVPANTRHWFDMGPEPEFIAIRLFNNPQGWVAEYTGSDIASHYNRLED